MAKSIVELYACDRCGKEPANTWIITGPGGLSRQIDLCEQHGAPIGNAYALASPVPKAPVRPATGRRRTPAHPPAPGPAPEPAPEPIWR